MTTSPATRRASRASRASRATEARARGGRRTDGDGAHVTGARQQRELEQDLRASLAHDPSQSTRATRLAELRALPRRPTHPLALWLKERGVSHAQASEAMGIRPAELQRVLRDWKRPREAEFIAAALGVEVDELFPTGPTPKRRT